MILAVDVDYRATSAVAAALCFKEWFDASALVELTETIHGVAAYVPGQFYKRELPCVQSILRMQHHELRTIIIDGYVHLGKAQKPGLGMYLWESLDGTVPVIGVAKNRFRDTPMETELFRGTSQKPLYITSVGVELSEAKEQISSMHGPHRIPTLLKQVDQLCRQGQ